MAAAVADRYIKSECKIRGREYVRKGTRQVICSNGCV